MTDTTNTEPPLPSPCTSYYDDLDHEEIFCVSLRQAKFYGDARAAHAVAQIKGEPVAMVWKDWGGLHFSASGKTTDKEVELVNKVCITIGMPAGYFDALVGVWRGDDKNCHEIPLLRALVTAYCMGTQSAPATAEQPQAREITDAEIDALRTALICACNAMTYSQYWDRDPHVVNAVDKVRAAIALANGRGG